MNDFYRQREQEVIVGRKSRLGIAKLLSFSMDGSGLTDYPTIAHKAISD